VLYCKIDRDLASIDDKYFRFGYSFNCVNCSETVREVWINWLAATLLKFLNGLNVGKDALRLLRLELYLNEAFRLFAVWIYVIIRYTKLYIGWPIIIHMIIAKQRAPIADFVRPNSYKNPIKVWDMEGKTIFRQFYVMPKWISFFGRVGVIYIYASFSFFSTQFQIYHSNCM